MTTLWIALGMSGTALPLVLLALLAAIACLSLGVLTIRGRIRRRTGAITIGLVLVVFLLISALGSATVAQADPIDCAQASSGSGASLSITQTSTLEGLGPNRAPLPITGRVANESDTATLFVAAITVTIDSVTRDPRAPAGTCDASDYVLKNPRMLVGETLAPGHSAPFSGASLGFRNDPSAQDPCQGAVVHLLYQSE